MKKRLIISATVSVVLAIGIFFGYLYKVAEKTAEIRGTDTQFELVLLIGQETNWMADHLMFYWPAWPEEKEVKPETKAETAIKTVVEHVEGVSSYKIIARTKTGIEVPMIVVDDPSGCFVNLLSGNRKACANRTLQVITTDWATKKVEVVGEEVLPTPTPSPKGYAGLVVTVGFIQVNNFDEWNGIKFDGIKEYTVYLQVEKPEGSYDPEYESKYTREELFLNIP